MIFVQSVKVFFAILVVVLNMTVTEMRPNNAPYSQNEDFRVDEIPSASSISDETTMDADSFALAPDVQDAPRWSGFHNYRIRKEASIG